MKLNLEVMNLGNQIALNLKLRYIHKVFKNFCSDRAVHDHCYLARPLTECRIDNGLKVCTVIFQKGCVWIFKRTYAWAKFIRDERQNPHWGQTLYTCRSWTCSEGIRFLQYEQLETFTLIGLLHVYAVINCKFRLTSDIQNYLSL